MPDVALLARAFLVGAMVASTFFWLASRGAPGPWRRGVCWSWAIGAGILCAVGAVDQWPHWPALEDRARFVTWIVPLTLAVEALTAALSSGRLIWLVRCILAAALTPMLLHKTVYLADLNGPNSAEWSVGMMVIILSDLAIGLALVWAAIDRLQTRTSTREVLWILELDVLASAITLMLSGYFQAGLLGLCQAGAIGGAVLASYFARTTSPHAGVGMAVVSVFAAVLMGRFFGTLTTPLAAALWLAPCLAWIVELPALRGLAGRRRTVVRFALVAIPLLVVVIVAQRKFAADTTRTPIGRSVAKNVGLGALSEQQFCAARFAPAAHGYFGWPTSEPIG